MLKYESSLENKNSTHSKILGLVGHDRYVLELGCASGYMTRYMKEELNCRVVCVEIDPGAAGMAKPFCEKMVVGDVETLDFGEIGLDDHYDVILMADILEHLKAPQELLSRLHRYLAPEGFLLISIPNGTHGAVALEFLDGKVEYRDTGLLDNTHLRFFDKDGFMRMLDSSGYLVSHLDRIIVHPRDTEIKTSWEKYPREVTAYMEKVNPEFQTYQFIIRAFSQTETGWKKGLEEAIRSQRDLRLDLEIRIKAVQKDLDRYRNENDRLNQELKEKEDRYSQLLAAENLRIENEIRGLHKDYQREIERQNEAHHQTLDQMNKEMDRLNNEFTRDRIVYEDSIRRLEHEIKEVHKGYQAEIDRQQNEILKKDRTLETVRNDFQQMQAVVRTLEQDIKTIHLSLAWRMLQKYRTVIDKVMPEHSGRRRFYRLSLLAPVVLFKEGPTRFAGKIIQRLPRMSSRSKSIRHDLVFTPREHIDVSIIIPVYNKVAYTCQCLESILAAADTRITFEIIVVDNASSDGTAKFLKHTRGIEVVSNKENKGFVEACNIGAARARGQYLLFLNNDTQVTPGWLDQLMVPFERDDRTGITGAKLIYPDGTLQEAGGIIWQDGSGWNYGKGHNPDLPEYAYQKEVDYCSGACIMIPKTLWEKAGGFDMRYAPAYYEDTDLCFTIRKMGYQVIFRPQARIIHHEGISAGTDINTGFKKFQQVNREKFIEKWKDILRTEHDAGPDDLFTARQRSSGKTILVVDHYAPTFDRDSGSLRMFSILKLLARMGHRVIFWPENRAHTPYVSHLQDIGVEALYGDIRFEDYLRAHGQNIDLILFSRPHVAVNMIYSARTFSCATIVYDTVDLHFLREERRAAFDQGACPDHWKKIEFFLFDMADRIVVVSDVEKNILEKEGYGNKVSVITNVHEIMGCKTPFDERKGLLFIGGFLHTPNEDAMLWFVERIFPKIQQSIPDIRITIVGSHPTDAIRVLDGKNIHVTGFVEDVSPYFENSRVFVSPLRYGAGVKGKIGQSLSFGLPVVTTPVGAEGMGLKDNETMLLAEDETVFAQKVIALYHDPVLWKKLSQNGMQLIQDRFSPDVIRESLVRLMEQGH